MEQLCYLLALHAFLIAAICFGMFLVRASEKLLRGGNWSSLAGLVLQSVGLAWAHVEGGSSFGAAGLFYAMMSWSIVGVFHLILLRHPVRPLGVVVAPLAVLFNSLALLSHGADSVVSTPPVWVSLHIGVTTWGEALFAMAAASGILYVYQDWRLRTKHVHGAQYLPDLATLDSLGLRLIRYGFVLLTLGVGSGVAAAYIFNRTQMLSDPTSLVFKATWGLYLALLVIRALGRIGGRKSAILNVACFALALIALLSANLSGAGSVHMSAPQVG